MVYALLAFFDHMLVLFCQFRTIFDEDEERPVFKTS